MNAALASPSRKDDRRINGRKKGSRLNPWWVGGRLFHAGAELLERRLVLASASLVGTTWIITGDAVADDLLIQQSGSSLTASDDTIVFATVSEGLVNSITVNALGGNDIVTISSFVSKRSTLNGGTDNDTLIGGGGDDTLAGDGGNDTYKFSGSSNLGSDFISETALTAPDNSVDTIDFTALEDGAALDLSLNTSQTVTRNSGNLVLQLSDTAGIERLLGSPHSDDFHGNARPNTFEGRDDDSNDENEEGDSLRGGDGKDTLDGGNGHDCVHGEGDNDLEKGGPGNDAMGDDLENDDTGTDVIYGGSGNDTLDGGPNEDTIYGEQGSVDDGTATGNDTIRGDDGEDWIYGGRGNDTIAGGSERDRIWGDYKEFTESAEQGVNEGEDDIDGGTGDDIIYGDTYGAAAGHGNGHDLLKGGDGFDSITGDGGMGPGHSVRGRDTLIGGRDNDTLVGEDDPDVYSFEGNDQLVLGSDQIVEGTSGYGSDMLDFAPLDPPGAGGVTINLGTTSSQTVAGLNLSLTIPTADTVEAVDGTLFGDTITGNGRANTLRGLGGNDLISGAAEADTIWGGDGNDDLTGGIGADILYGEAGSDTFHTLDGTVDSLFGGLGSDTATDRDSNDARPALDIESW
jgi:Ca2+-binding RTX toxin-like protein